MRYFNLISVMSCLAIAVPETQKLTCALAPLSKPFSFMHLFDRFICPDEFIFSYIVLIYQRHFSYYISNLDLVQSILIFKVLFPFVFQTNFILDNFPTFFKNVIFNRCKNYDKDMKTIKTFAERQGEENIFILIYNNKQMKQMSRVIQPQNINIEQWLQEQLKKSTEVMEDADNQNAIKAMIEYRQNKIYHFFTYDLHSYFGTIWEHIVADNPDFEAVIIDKMGQKQNIVYQDLKEQKLKITQRAPLVPFDYDQESKNNRINLLRQQSDSLKKKINEINNNLEAQDSQNQAKDIKDVYNKLYSEEKIKQAEQFVRKNKEAQQQRRRKLQQQRKKQQEALLKKETQIKEQEEEMLKARRQEVIKKQKQLHERREKQKQIREQRNTEYMRIRKSINEKPPLFQKLYEGYSKRYNEQENERLTKMHSQRKHYLEHVNSKLLEQHEKNYDQLRQKKDKQRKQRQQAAKSEAKSRTKVHSSFELPKYIDPREVEKQQGKQKLQKMKQYKSIVKQKFQPKIDQDKRKQLMNLIEQMQLNHKRVKRVKLQNGSVMYEQLKPADPKMIGIEYLQMTKQMAAKARERKKQEKDVVVTDPSKQIKKPINYLEELRKNRPKQEKSAFVEKKNMSYDDKVKKVMLQSEKLAEITKQNEMMLKFGKFKTSQQILACKQEIDQNYLNIVNMKLKLILSQQHPDEQQSQVGSVRK